MKHSRSLSRNTHFLGTKVRNLRKRSNLTMEDLSARCIKINADYAPSVSYLSMIERGKRVPSEAMLEVIAQVFEKPLRWFMDDSQENEAITPDKGRKGGIRGMPLEPSFLFSNEILQIAVPEMLSQTGVSGQQFAHLLIRAYQEHHQNHFPDLERAAEEVGRKQLPLTLDAVMQICKDMGLEIHWFDRLPDEITDETGAISSNLIRSFFAPPNRVYVNEKLKSQPVRLKYDLAVQIAHRVLHNSDGVKSIMIAGRGGERPINADSASVEAKDIINAWRDFECSFFASALLCPKVPFRQLLDRHNYEVNVSQIVDVSPSVAMRRMTAVSPYPHWHYFDAYPPGMLRAVYRGNGIPLPWGNMRLVQDPCQHWAVFRMLDKPDKQTFAQISVLESNGEPHIYACESVKLNDLAGNNHVLCAGVDLNPALESQGKNALDIAEALKTRCAEKGGTAPMPKSVKSDLSSVSKILNIGWVERGIENRARLICPRSSDCPRDPACAETQGQVDNDFSLEQVRQQIIASTEHK